MCWLCLRRRARREAHQPSGTGPFIIVSAARHDGVGAIIGAVTTPLAAATPARRAVATSIGRTSLAGMLVMSGFVAVLNFYARHEFHTIEKHLVFRERILRRFAVTDVMPSYPIPPTFSDVGLRMGSAADDEQGVVDRDPDGRGCCGRMVSAHRDRRHRPARPSRANHPAAVRRGLPAVVRLPFD